MCVGGYTVMIPKIAVCINGIFPDDYPEYQLLDNLRLYKHVFKKWGADFYGSTWESERKRFVECGLTDDILKINYIENPYPDGLPYDPYVQMLRTLYNAESAIDNYLLEKSEIIEQSKGDETEPTTIIRKKEHQRNTFGCHRIMQTDMQMRAIPNIDQYDFIFHLRWDLHMSSRFPVGDILNLAQQSVVGINCDFDKRDWAGYEKVGEDGFPVKRQERTFRDNTHEHYLLMAKHKNKVIRDNFYTVIDHRVNKWRWELVKETGNPPYHTFHEGWLSDPMFVIKPVDIPEVSVLEMIEKEELVQAEYGFFQTYTTKRPHRNVNGLISIKRLSNESREEWEYSKSKGLKL